MFPASENLGLYEQRRSSALSTAKCTIGPSQIGATRTEVRACRDSVEAKKGVAVGAKVVLLQRQAALVPDVHDSQNLPHHSRGVIPIQKR